MEYFFTAEIAVILAVALATAVFLLGYLQKIKKRGAIARSLNLSLFLVTVPRHVKQEENDSQGQEEDHSAGALMEGLYSTLSVLTSTGLSKFKFGNPYITLEMAVHHVGEEIHFYVAVPEKFATSFEKRIHGAYPAANIEKVKDYNIFSSDGVYLGSVGQLKRDPVLPIHTYKNLKADTLDQISTAFSKISHEGEGAALQLVVRPAKTEKYRKRAESIVSLMKEGKSFKQALSLVKKKESTLGSAFNLFSDSKKEEDITKKPEGDEEVMKEIRQKAGQAGFECNLRLLVSSKEKFRAEELLSEIEGAFAQFDSPLAGGLKFSRLKRGSLRDLAFYFSFRLFDPKRILYLSAEELASLYHFPLGGVAAPRVKYLKTRPFEPPSDLSAQGITLGKNVFRGVDTSVKMSDDDRRRHLYMIGQTGTGKSSLMKYMVEQDIRNGKGVCVIDPHGDFADYCLGVVPDDRVDDIIYFNPGILDRVLGMNMLSFDPARPEQKTFIVNELLKIFDKLYDLKQTGGPLFEQYFRNALLLVMDDAENDPPTFASVSRVLADADYRKAKLSRETNPLVKQFWVEQAEKAGGEAALANMVPYVTSKFDQFLANDFMRPILNQVESSFDFREVMDEGKILVVNLSKGRIGDMNANLLGMIVVGRLLMSALSRGDMPEEERKDFYLYIDEFQNFTTDSIATILSEARKYRLDLVIAHQFIKQLPENIRDAVFGNVGSMVSFRVGAEDAEALEKQFEPTITANDLSNVDNFNAYVRLLINNQTSRPFNVQTIKPKEPDLERARMVADRSLARYGRAREEVEEKILSGYKKEESKQERSNFI